MATMKIGTNTGIQDEFLAPICVGDEIIDKAGNRYTIDRFGRAKPTDGGNEVPLKGLEGVTVTQRWDAHAEAITKAAEQPAPQKEQAPAPDPGHVPTWQETTTVAVATDQELCDELRSRGYEVTATKTTIVVL